MNKMIDENIVSPQQIEKIKGLLGMARRAGQIVAGFDAVVASVLNEKAFLVMLASDISVRTKNDFIYKSEKIIEPVFLPMSKEEISAALGLRRDVGVISVCNEGFAKRLKEIICCDDKTIS